MCSFLCVPFSFAVFSTRLIVIIRLVRAKHYYATLGGMNGMKSEEKKTLWNFITTKLQIWIIKHDQIVSTKNTIQLVCDVASEKPIKRRWNITYFFPSCLCCPALCKLHTLPIHTCNRNRNRKFPINLKFTRVWLSIGEVEAEHVRASAAENFRNFHRMSVKRCEWINKLAHFSLTLTLYGWQISLINAHSCRSCKVFFFGFLPAQLTIKIENKLASSHFGAFAPEPSINFPAGNVKLLRSESDKRGRREGRQRNWSERAKIKREMNSQLASLRRSSINHAANMQIETKRLC